jgi:hypothetical protein
MGDTIDLNSKRNNDGQESNPMSWSVEQALGEAIALARQRGITGAIVLMVEPLDDATTDTDGVSRDDAIHMFVSGMNITKSLGVIERFKLQYMISRELARYHAEGVL